MKPELKVLTPEDAPKPPQDEKQSPAQSEMPFAVVDGEPVTALASGPLYSTVCFAGVSRGVRGAARSAAVSDSVARILMSSIFRLPKSPK